MSTLTIDPAITVEKCAWAHATEGTLTGVGFGLEGLRRKYAPHRVIVERPAYQGGRSDSARTQDLLALSWAGARFAYSVAGPLVPVIEWTPSEWKGSARKPQHHAKIWAKLTPAERTLLGGDATARAIDSACEKGARERWARPGVEYYPRTFKTHNLIDAVGMQLKDQGRL